MKRLSLFAAVLLIGFSAGAAAQTLMTVDDVAAFAEKHSRDIVSATDSVEGALEAVQEVFTLENSSFSISSGYNYNPDAPSQHGLSLDGSISVPIIPQVSFSASLKKNILDDSDASGTARITYNPFAGNTSKYKEWEAYRKAEVQLGNLQNTIPMNAEEAALDLIRGQMNLVSAEKAFELEELTYEVAKKRYELDDITYTELENARSALGSARQKVYDSQKSLLSLQRNIYQMLGAEFGDILIAELTTDDVLLMITGRESQLEEAVLGNPSTVNLLNRAIELEALKQQLDDTPVFEPNLSISANINYFDFRAGSTVSITLSPNQLQTDERDDLVIAIEDKKLDLDLEQANLELDLRMLDQSISIAREALEISLNDYENAQVQFSEAELLFTYGERTAIELETAELSLYSSQIKLYTSAVDLYKTLGDLLLLYRLS
ncbi:MAG: TolC family protein [Spirochaetales bacterium]|jgi:hypothetical protein|nr:TolC family protein [Spirochaetales bacterium]